MYYAKSEEDIIGRLEALRRRTPAAPRPGGEPPAPTPTPPPDEERRRRIYRIVGFAVIAIIVLGVFFVGYKAVIKPLKEKGARAPEEKLYKEEASKIVEEGKNILRGKIADAFSGLPPEYRKDEAKLMDRVEKAGSIEELKAIDYKTAATLAWRAYVRDELNRKVEEAGDENRVLLTLGNTTYKGYREAISALSQYSYTILRNFKIEVVARVFVPIKLPREQAAAGLIQPGDYVNIYYSDGENTTEIAKNARVVAYLRATTQISLSENENRIISGQGGEAKGEGSISTGGVSSLVGPISIGMRQSSSSTTYTVDIKEVQKAAAASKLSEEYIKNVLMNYGIRLSQIELESQVGNFDEEYLLLIEMSEDEAKAMISKAISDNEKKKLWITLAKPSSWMEK